MIPKYLINIFLVIKKSKTQSSIIYIHNNKLILLVILHIMVFKYIHITRLK